MAVQGKTANIPTWWIAMAMALCTRLRNARVEMIGSARPVMCVWRGTTVPIVNFPAPLNAAAMVLSTWTALVTVTTIGRAAMSAVYVHTQVTMKQLDPSVNILEKKHATIMGDRSRCFNLVSPRCANATMVIGDQIAVKPFANTKSTAWPYPAETHKDVAELNGGQIWPLKKNKE